MHPPKKNIENYEKTLYVTNRDLDIIHVLFAGHLSDFEKKFLKSVQRAKDLSIKQRACLEKIIHKYLREKS